MSHHFVLDRSGCSPSLRSERRRRSVVVVRFRQVLHVELAARQLAVDVVVVESSRVHLLCVAAMCFTVQLSQNSAAAVDDIVNSVDVVVAVVSGIGLPDKRGGGPGIVLALQTEVVRSVSEL